MYSHKTNVIPDSGQRVRLLERRGRPVRGRYVAFSGPFTDANGELMIRVAGEREYREALREGRLAKGMPWPARQMEVFSFSEGHEGAQETETAHRPWWVRWFGG